MKFGPYTNLADARDAKERIRTALKGYGTKREERMHNLRWALAIRAEGKLWFVEPYVPPAPWDLIVPDEPVAPEEADHA